MKPYLLLLVAVMAGTLHAQSGTVTTPNFTGSLPEWAHITAVGGSGTKAVEPLTPVEKKRIADAQIALNDAQAKFDETMREIKQAHGEEYNGMGNGLMCRTSETTVTIWGDFALIDKHPIGGCVAW